MDNVTAFTGSWNRLKLVSTMVYSIFISLVVFSLIFMQDTSGHGALIEPPMRSVLWKYGFDAPINYNYMELYCGGFQNFQNNGGRCGVCGDSLQGPHGNERGGKYDLGIIARSYPEGTTSIDVKVEITAHHKGYFEFKLCPNDEAEVTQECLDRYPLMIEEGIQQGDPMKFYPPDGQTIHSLKVSIPPDIRCERCVLQWTYRAGNRWGTNPDGKSCLGCGMQETFINCADISVRSHSSIVNTLFESFNNLPTSDEAPSFGDHKDKAVQTTSPTQKLNGIAPNNTRNPGQKQPSDQEINRQQNDIKQNELENFLAKLPRENKVISTTSRKDDRQPATVIEALHNTLKPLNATGSGLVRNDVHYNPRFSHSIDSQLHSTGWNDPRSVFRPLQSEWLSWNSNFHSRIPRIDTLNHLLLNNTSMPQLRFNSAASHDDMVMHSRESVSQAHMQSLPEQRITGSARQKSIASHSQLQTPFLETAQWINPIQIRAHQENSLFGQQHLPRISPSNAHLFPVNEIHMANVIHTQTFSTRQPNEIIAGLSRDVQTRMSITSSQAQEFYQRLAFVASLNNAHQLRQNLKHASQMPIERARAIHAAIQNLHSVVPNTIHREALIRNTILSDRQLRMDRRFSGGI
ncbi:hypothetical protein CHS0354_009470 [Potamilus streckersoni]|uniref:Chitin-binding type-4 domain-containing protein n=1 Tax=Potamilus streckersoni TaxID=2493646 RepID=A0AAE0RVV9_9BIVA|nr:hypothetical protein CHS0354_009470 [Potamilus streckersoni]